MSHFKKGSADMYLGENALLKLKSNQTIKRAVLAIQPSVNGKKKDSACLPDDSFGPIKSIYEELNVLSKRNISFSEVGFDKSFFVGKDALAKATDEIFGGDPTLSPPARELALLKIFENYFFSLKAEDRIRSGKGEYFDEGEQYYLDAAKEIVEMAVKPWLNQDSVNEDSNE